MKTYIFLLSLFFTFLSCKEENTTGNSNNEYTGKNIELDSVVNPNVKREVVSNILDSLPDIKSIKSQVTDVTFGFLNKRESKFYPKNLKNNFLGHYILLKGKAKSSIDRVGRLIIYDSINPSIYEKATDELIEITINTSSITLYSDRVKVGMNYYEVIKLFGEKYVQYDDETIFYKKDNKMAFFKIKDSVVTDIKIGLYKENVDIAEFLNYSGWFHHHIVNVGNASN